MAEPDDVESIARARLRSLRQSQGWSLDQLGERSHLSPSTISRIETGKRALSLDVLIPLARALHVDINALIEAQHGDDDVVIRPEATDNWPGSIVWPLSRPSSTITAIKTRLEPGDVAPDPQVHPGHDWLYVLSGRVLLILGDRRITIEAGEAAEFSTMTPHAVAAVDAPAELVMIFDRDGRRAHLHS